MFFANDANGNRVEISEACCETEYFCPVCGNSLILKAGQVNASHFAHRQGGCTDNWHYDMSDWHLKMQNFFPPECREVVLSNNGRTHRADIKIQDIVIEIQYSPISAEEFVDRNKFFNELGLRLAWVFNLENQVASETLYFDDYRANLMIWKYPMRILSKAPQPSDYNEKFAIWFARCTEWMVEDTGDSYEFIRKVVWSAQDDEGKPSYKRFVLGDYSICLDTDEKIEPEYFFYSNKDYFREALCELKEKSSYEIKYIGVKGHSQNSYICPLRTNEFGIRLYGSNGCLKCRYCAMLAHKERKEEEKWAVYCCYPKRIHFYQEDFEEDAPIYDL